MQRLEILRFVARLHQPYQQSKARVPTLLFIHSYANISPPHLTGAPRVHSRYSSFLHLAPLLSTLDCFHIGSGKQSIPDVWYVLSLSQIIVWRGASGDIQISQSVQY